MASWAERRLAATDRRIAATEARVARQRELIAREGVAGDDTTPSREVLALLERSLALTHRQRRTILQGIAGTVASGRAVILPASAATDSRVEKPSALEPADLDAPRIVGRHELGTGRPT